MPAGLVTDCNNSRYVELFGMSVKPIPDGYHTVTPYLIVGDAAAALEFYKRAFGGSPVSIMLYVEEVTEEEIGRRFQEMMEKGECE